MKIKLAIVLFFALIILPFGARVSAQEDYYSGILAKIEEIRRQIDILKQLLATLPSQTGSVDDGGIESSSVRQIYPLEADITLPCVANSGYSYPVTGRNSASWFLWNNCAREKIYRASTNSMIALEVFGDYSPKDSVCRYPNFTLYDNIDGVWQKAARVNLANVSSGTAREYLYAPVSSQIKIEASSCFYMRVYEGSLSALERQFSEHIDMVFGYDYGPAADYSAQTSNSDLNSNYRITLLSPSGGEIWRSGRNYNIAWSSAGINKVWISVKNSSYADSSGLANYIDSNFTAVPAASGFYSWTIKDSWLPKGDRNKYKISIAEYKADGSLGISDESGYVTILAP